MSVSWLTLERYHLGEASADEVAQVRAALATDPVARARLDEIMREHGAVRPKPIKTASTARRWVVPALAASVMLFSSLLLSQILSPSLSNERSPGIKGDALVLSVLRQHDGVVAADATRLVVGDKYKLQVTCVPPRDAVLSVKLKQDSETTNPFGESVRLQCANDVPLGDALVFDSESEAELCVKDAGNGRQSCIKLR